MEHSATPFAPVADRRIKMSMPTLAMGVAAVAATTVATTLCMTRPDTGAASVSKFAEHRPIERRNLRLHGTPPAWTPPKKKATKAGEEALEVGRYGNNEGYMYVAPDTAEAPVDFGDGVTAGVLKPVGYLDPLGFATATDSDRLRWFREAELKHGRIAMLAAVGFLIGENPDLKTVLWPNNPEFAGSGGLASHTFTDHNLDLFWLAFVGGVGTLEAAFFTKFDSVLDLRLSDDYAVGDLGFDPLGLKPADDAGFIEKRNKELQNGRLAMLAIAGFNAQEMTDGKPIWPLHAFTDDVDAAEINTHIDSGLSLVKEMGQMLMDTSTAQ